VLKQPQFSPLPAEEQVVAIYAGTRGHLDSVPVGDVRRFETELLEHMRHNEAGVLAEIRDTKDLSEDNEERLVNAINAVKEQFTAADGSSVVNEPETAAMDESEVGRESVKVRRAAPARK
jgi:F-type H+-transporting ATPase subunit alpha